MKPFLFALLAFAVAFVGMALGALCRGRCLRGTCGGLAGMRDEHGTAICDACGRHQPQSDMASEHET